MNERHVYDFSKNGECSRCCHCCGPLIPLTMREANKMKELYKTDEYVRRVVDRNCSIVYNEETGEFDRINLICPFADLEEHKCSIYNDRPQVCRVFRCHNYNTQDIKDCEQKAYYNHINYYKNKDKGGGAQRFMTIYRLLDKGLMHNIYLFYHFKDEINKAIVLSKECNDWSKLYEVLVAALSKKHSNKSILCKVLAELDKVVHFDKGTLKKATEIINKVKEFK